MLRSRPREFEETKIKVLKQLELKMFYQTQTAHRPPKSTPVVTEWSRLLLNDVICRDSVPFRRCRGWWSAQRVLLSVQQFPRYSTHKQKTRAKDVLLKTDRMEAAVSVHSRQSPAATQCSRLLLDDVICSVRRTRRLTMHCQYGGKPLWWPWHSNSSERGTKHVFPVIFAQIHSAVPEIFEAQKRTKNTAKDVLPNIHRTQAAKRTPPRQQRNGILCRCVTLFATSAFHSVATVENGNA